MRHAIALFALTAIVATAQDARVTGVVVDAETGAPLPSVNVFVSGTTRGAATDAQGRFALDRLTPGAFTLAASMVGYQTSAQDLTLRAGDAEGVRFRLQPSTASLESVDVSVSRDRSWERSLERFTRLFIGDTPNARRTTIRNPEVLDFESLPPGGVEARGRATLVVDNQALGYRVTFYSLRFRGDASYRGWTGQVGFTPLEPDDDRQAQRWANARERAYRGSPRHLFAALAAGRAAADGFRVQTVVREGRQSRLPGLSDEALTDRLVPAPGNAALQCLPVSQALLVDYIPERSRQRSWLTFQRPEVCFDDDGIEADPHDVTRYGYWDRERVAELLPTDYHPAN